MSAYKFAAGMTLATLIATAAITVAQMDQTGGALQQKCQQAMQQMKQLREPMQQMDQTLDEELAAMEHAQGQTKVDAMGVVIRTLVEQRKQIHQAHEQMQDRMWQHIGEHIAAGAQGQQTMMQCPLLKGEGAMPAAGVKQGATGAATQDAGTTRSTTGATTTQRPAPSTRPATTTMP